MTESRILQDCPLHEALRRDTWPQGNSLKEQPHGDREQLLRMATFIRTTGLTVRVNEEEEETLWTLAIFIQCVPVTLGMFRNLRKLITISPCYHQVKLFYLLGFVSKATSKKNLVIVLLISQIRGGGRFFLNFLFFRRPQNKACVCTRTMQTSIESTPWPTWTRRKW
jgi:hypothetical protein